MAKRRYTPIPQNTIVLELKILQSQRGKIHKNDRLRQKNRPPPGGPLRSSTALLPRQLLRRRHALDRPRCRHLRRARESRSASRSRPPDRPQILRARHHRAQCGLRSRGPEDHRHTRGRRRLPGLRQQEVDQRPLTRPFQRRGAHGRGRGPRGHVADTDPAGRARLSVRKLCVPGSNLSPRCTSILTARRCRRRARSARWWRT